MSILQVARIACLVGLLTALAAIPLSAGAGDAPVTSDMARCAAITPADARLACFDALAVASANRGAPAINKSPPPVPGATPPDAIGPRAAPDDPGTFGLSPPKLHSVPVGRSAIKARVSTFSADQPGIGHPMVILDNGQTWAFVEAVNDPRLAPGATVTIKRAALGSYLLTTASQHTYHVRRTQ